VDVDGDSNVDRDAATLTLRPAPIPRWPLPSWGTIPTLRSRTPIPPMAL